MNTAIIDKMHAEQKKGKKIPTFRIGDDVRVHVKIKEGDKERVQVYAGTVIARDGHGSTETFTVRRISYGEGVERVFPVYCRSVEKIEIERSGHARRAKLYYLRGRAGKSSKLRTEERGPREEAAADAKA
jgi:large subunit ribosomal protein L19